MSMPRLRVSIVIPALDEERHIAACLDAIAAHTVQPYEVIVVDNNCTDKTVTITGKYPFVRVVREVEQGRVFARDAGFDAARGEIIGRIDADILLPPNWVEYITDFYAEPSHEQNAWTGAGYFYNVRMPGLVSFAYGLLAFQLNKLLLGYYTVWGSNMAITKKQWQAVRTSVHRRSDIHEDLDLAIHLAKAGYRITYDAKIKVRAELRRVHSNRHELLEYLNWWPRTVRIHNNSAWVICWFFGVFVLYLATLVLIAADKLARLFRR